MRVVHPTDELLDELVRPEPALDRSAVLLAAHALPGLDVGRELGRLDDLAAGVGESSIDALCAHLFGPGGLAGNRADYYDPRNSLLPVVLDRRLGIPITLSVVAIEVGRRLGLQLVGVGMPGHFLVGDPRGERFLDAFNGGTVLDQAGCEARFHELHGPSMAFHPSFLGPVSVVQIVQRMLANLRVAYRRLGDRRNLAWVLSILARQPGAGPDDHRVLAEVLVSLGRYDRAAAALEEAARLGGTARDRVDADALRARLN